jgi:riboflavin kinase/FMN adenylyltransferase
MRIIRDTHFIDPENRGGVAAIGNFDGVHLGHQAVIDIARAEATRRGVPLGIMTFEPHPRNFFAPATPAFRLMNAEAKANRLDKLGVERLFEVPFNKALAELDARAFAQTVICDQLGLDHVVVGQDFCFGKGRSGNAETLKAFGAEMGFGVTIAQMVALDAGEVSSTNIRAALADGRPRVAAEMLGHWHRIVGEVIRGDQRGRDLGYPYRKHVHRRSAPAQIWGLRGQGRRSERSACGQLHRGGQHRRAPDVWRERAKLRDVHFRL